LRAIAKTIALVECIKPELRSKNITYKMLAEHLKISASAVKHTRILISKLLLDFEFQQNT